MRGGLGQPSDQELIDATLAGDKRAFEVFVSRNYARLYRSVVQVVKDPAIAEDVTQDAFVQAYGALDRFDGRAQPYTWLFRIARNLSYNELRWRKVRGRTQPIEDPTVEPLVLDKRASTADPAQRAVDRQLAGALAEAVDSLSETLRTTLLMVVVDALSHAEIAEALGCPEGTVAWRVHEARRKIRGYLDERGHLAVEHGGSP